MQGETRHNKVLWFGASYIRDLRYLHYVLNSSMEAWAAPDTRIPYYMRTAIFVPFDSDNRIFQY